MDPQITAIIGIGIGLAAMLWRVSRDIRKDHKAEIHQTRDELKAEIHQARTELKADIEARSADLRADIAAVRLSVSNLHADQLVYVKPPPRKRRTGRRTGAKVEILDEVDKP